MLDYGLQPFNSAESGSTGRRVPRLTWLAFLAAPNLLQNRTDFVGIIQLLCNPDGYTSGGTLGLQISGFSRILMEFGQFLGILGQKVASQACFFEKLKKIHFSGKGIVRDAILWICGRCSDSRTL